MIRLFTVAFLAFSCLAVEPASPRYVGPETCALCHSAIAARQRQTAMANTWQASNTTWLPSDFQADATDDLTYNLRRTPDSFTYTVTLPNHSAFTLPAAILLGGRRHGLGFLLPIAGIGGIPLARSALLQARHAWSMDKKKLLLAPGSVASAPASLESALGLTLSPTFESRCLACHGQPNVEGSGKAGGVHCESCHGPGSDHLRTTSKIINPKRLTNEQSIEVCARCHLGLTHFSDPAPQDLLVANQAVAIRSSECYLQSGKAFSCTTCHDPHSDAPDNSRAVRACLGCHSNQAKPHAALCPVNAKADCVRCHMPSVEMGPLHLVDHSIRVHPEQATAATAPTVTRLSQIAPLSEYLRIISLPSASQAAEAELRLKGGETFYHLAYTLSQDPSAGVGGYWGRKTLADLAPELARTAALLEYGATSPVIQQPGRWSIIQRLPRDFRWQAEQLQLDAETLAAKGNSLAAIEASQQALKLYPYYLRALTFIAVTYAQSGNPKRGAQVLTTAAKLYPGDATVQFELAVIQEFQGNKASAAAGYRNAIALDNDLTAAYIKLGNLSNSIGDLQSALKTFRAGLQIDPLSADLYHGLASVLEQSGDLPAAKQAAGLAAQLAPR